MYSAALDAAIFGVHSIVLAIGGLMAEARVKCLHRLERSGSGYGKIFTKIY